MKVLIATAKTLEFCKPIPHSASSQPLFLAESKQLVQLLQKRSASQLAALLGVSADLAALNCRRYSEWKTPFTVRNARPAIFTFNGLVYRGFDFPSYSKSDYERLQSSVRILSGLHGVLRPFDLIQPYRLEMGTRLANPAGNDLYAYWRETVTASLRNECKGDIIINCAPKEYTACVDFDALDCPVVNIVFKNYKDGKYKVITLHAKKARGLFADFVVRTNSRTVQDLKKFTAGGYRFDATASQPNELVFLAKEVL